MKRISYCCFVILIITLITMGVCGVIKTPMSEVGLQTSIQLFGFLGILSYLLGGK